MLSFYIYTYMPLDGGRFGCHGSSNFRGRCLLARVAFRAQAAQPAAAGLPAVGTLFSVVLVIVAARVRMCLLTVSYCREASVASRLGGGGGEQCGG